MPAASTRPSSMAASSTPTAPTRAWATSDWMVVEADEMRRHLRQAAGRRRARHQHRPRASRPLRHLRPGARGLPPVRRERAVLRLRVMCIDHPEVQALVGRIEDRRIITYGANPQADVRFTDHRMVDGALGVRPSSIRDRMTGGQTDAIEDLRLPMPGEHNVSERHRRHRRRRISSASPPRRSRRGLPASAASSAASPRPASGTASTSSTTTATTRSRSPRC